MRYIIKIFIVLCLLAAAGGAVGSSFYLRDMATQGLMDDTSNGAEALAGAYVGSIWGSYRDIIVASSFSPEQQAQQAQHIRSFAHYTQQFFNRAPLARVNIYVRGQWLYSVEGTKRAAASSQDPSPDKSFLVTHFKSTSRQHQLIATTNPAGETLDILHVVIPLRSDKDAPDTALEFVYNLSEPLATIRLVTYAANGAIGAMLLFCVLVIGLVSKRSEALVAKLHEENVILAGEAQAAKAENQEKSKFLANISHELRTPLNAIIGFSDILKTEVIDAIGNQKYSQYITDIHSAGVHLLSLINDILDYSKAEAGKLELEVGEVNASKMVHNCVRLVSTRAEAGKVTLLESLPKDQIVMHTDGKKFKQIVLNLLSNAVKFTPGGGEVKISGWHNLAEDSYTFEVVDTGIGIAAKDISIALSPFGQIDSALSRKYEGTGLGLPLTKKFVELLGGTFTITSKVGVGTTITFTLPRELKPAAGVLVKSDLPAATA